MSRTARADADRGDTLLEVLISLAIVAIAATALIGSIMTSITSSSEHRTLALNDVYLKDYADSAAQQIQRDPTNPLYSPCASTYNVTTPSNIPSSWTIGITGIQYWNTTTKTWTGSCVAANRPAQLITVAVSSPIQTANSLSFVVRSPT